MKVNTGKKMGQAIHEKGSCQKQRFTFLSHSCRPWVLYADISSIFYGIRERYPDIDRTNVLRHD